MGNVESVPQTDEVKVRIKDHQKELVDCTPVVSTIVAKPKDQKTKDIKIIREALTTLEAYAKTNKKRANAILAYWYNNCTVETIREYCEEYIREISQMSTSSYEALDIPLGQRYTLPSA